MSFAALPNDALYEVLKDFALSEIVRLFSVNKAFNERLCRSESLWRLLYRRDVSETILPAGSYRQAYREALSATRFKTSKSVSLAAQKGWEKRLECLLAIATEYGPTAIGNHSLLVYPAEHILRGAAVYGAASVRNYSLAESVLKREKKDEKYLLDQALAGAAFAGDEEKMEQYVKEGATDLIAAAKAAAYAGHSRLVRATMERIRPLSKKEMDILFSAAFGGRNETVNELLDCLPDPQNWRSGFLGAAQGGHRSTLDLLVGRLRERLRQLCSARRDARRGLERQFLEESEQLARKAGHLAFAQHIRDGSRECAIL